MIKKLFSDSILYAVGPQLPRLVGFFLLPILTKYLTATDYAVWGICMAYVGGLSAIRSLGMDQVIVNAYYKNLGAPRRWKLLWQNIMGTLLLWGVPYIVILATVLYISLHPKIPSDVWMMIGVIGFQALTIDIINIFGFRYFQLSAKAMPITICTALSGTVSLVVQYISVVTFDMHYMSFLYSSFAGALVTALFFIIFFFKQQNFFPTFKLKGRLLRSQLNVGLPTIPHSYSSYMLSASDRVILDIYKQPLLKIGQYNFAYYIGNLADTVGSAMGLAISPFYMKLYAKGDKRSMESARDMTFVLQALFIGGSMVVCLWMKEIFEVLSSNHDLSLAYPMAILILMNFVYRPMYWASVSLLGFKEETKQLWKISFIGGMINIAINLVFIHRFGVYASIIGTFIGMMYMGFSGFFLKSYRKHNTIKYYPVAWLTAIILATILVYLVRDTSVLVRSLLSISVLVGGAFLAYKSNSFKSVIRMKF